MSKATNIPKQYKDLALVPESVLKKRHDLDELRRRQIAIKDGTHKNNGKRRNLKGASGAKSKGTYVVTPHNILSKTKTRVNYNRRMRRIRKKGMQTRAVDRKTFEQKVVEEELDSDDDEDAEPQALTKSVQSNSFGAKVVLVIRVREGVGQVPPQYHRKLQAKPLNLTHAFQASLVRYTPKMRATLHLLEPWIVYGVPSKATIQDLLERKSFGRDKMDKTARIPISDNVVLEEALGEHDILCMEDLAHALYEGAADEGSNTFEAATSFLWPFQLTSSKSHFETSTLKTKQGHDYGDKGGFIDEYVQRMV